ncbi:putative cytochrome P450 monooxygenase [Aspergillus nomiae NRRL 13137]|uniref:Putative cytochrome P450 monooxygenase n=1 Tax=Aspergillus nomiae NRRL (strain ATCC 15546 / NRRL 13137 / CBS 260.88 / M93) TaxID=1509407 RepID=A0A0L1JA81_ASPN3|nr:putative cytochrome P450 monooxygenase [Aspergillus nomiae NRRL 13137]KNG88605.1 putative cytochrome P450 monooxygenase [Aspergillus nomiae NRRL 13137]
MIGIIIFSLFISYTAYLGLCLIQHRNRARKIGLPYVSFPISSHNLFFLSLFETRIVPYVINTWLPPKLADYIYDSGFKTRWMTKDRLHKRHGGVYMLITPAVSTCMVGDASVASQICMSRQGFPKPHKQYGALDIYGPNIVTSEGSQWAHLRRHTAAAFNERTSALVWEETIRQTDEMVQYWKDEHTRSSLQSEFILTDAREDILKFTLNIICSVGYGVKLPFKPILENSTDSAEGLFKDAISPSPGYHFTFRSAMEYLNKHVTSIFIANGLPKCIPRSILPFFKKDFDAFDDIGRYLRALVSMAETKESLTQNLIDGLVRSKQQRNKGQGLDPDLTDDEILGNLFVFTIAGHETTAVALRFALVLLALNQDAQEYLYEGIREATCDEPHNPVEWDYRRVYPKLVSPLCVMLETLRMYPPVTTIPRWTGDSAVDITYQNQSYLLPPHVYISVNASGLHYSEEYWGPDAAVYDPKRWDKQNTESFLAKNEGVGLSGPGLEYDTIHKPVRGSYIPFSDGFRVCLGKKFAQVEFVVAVAIIFREYHVVLAKSSECKTEDDMRRRAEKVLQESTSFITLSMRDEVPLLFQKR